MKGKLIVVLIILFTQNGYFVKAIPQNLKAGPNINIGLNTEIGIFSSISSETPLKFMPKWFYFPLFESGVTGKLNYRVYYRYQKSNKHIYQMLTTPLKISLSFLFLSLDLGLIPVMSVTKFHPKQKRFNIKALIGFSYINFRIYAAKIQSLKLDVEVDIIEPIDKLNDKQAGYDELLNYLRLTFFSLEYDVLYHYRKK